LAGQWVQISDEGSCSSFWILFNVILLAPAAAKVAGLLLDAIVA